MKSLPDAKLSRQTDKIVERITVDSSGRFVIPANIRKAADVRAGQRFTISVYGEPPDQVIEMRTIENAIARAQAQMRKILNGRKVSAVDDLIAERRAEALKEG